MSKRSYDIYVSEVINLVKSFVIKSEHTATSINDYLIAANLNVDLDMPETWKYYLNLAGEYHPADAPIVVVSSDTQAPITLDRASIVTHPVTYIDCKRGGRLYNELIKKYPKRRLFIDAITSPVDTTESTSAPNFTILRWDASLIGSHEETLMQYVQDWLYKQANRWYNQAYNISDPLYEASFLATLAYQLVQIIVGRRLEMASTHEAAEFHIWCELGSNYQLNDYIQYLSADQALWLYRNVRHLRRDAGKESNLATMLDRLVAPKSLGASRFDFVHLESGIVFNGRPTARYSKTHYGQVSSSYDEDDLLTTREMLYLMLKEAPDNVSEVSNDEVDLTYKGRMELDSSMPVGVLIIDEVGTTQLSTETLLDIKINYAFYLAHLGLLNYSVSIPVPGSDAEHFMSAVDSLILMQLATEILMYGEESDLIPVVEVFNVLPILPPTQAEIVTRSYSALTPDEADKAISDYVPLTAMSTVEEFNQLALNIREMNLEHSLLAMSKFDAPSRSYSADAMALFSRAERCRLKPAGTTYNEWLSDIDFNKFGLSRSDWHDVIDSVLKRTLNIDSDLSGLTPDKSAMVDIVRRLTSYSLSSIEGEGTDSFNILELDLPTIGDASSQSLEDYSVLLGLNVDLAAKNFSEILADNLVGVEIDLLPPPPEDLIVEIGLECIYDDRDIAEANINLGLEMDVEIIVL